MKSSVDGREVSPIHREYESKDQDLKGILDRGKRRSPSLDKRNESAGTKRRGVRSRSSSEPKSRDRFAVASPKRQQSKSPREVRSRFSRSSSR